MSRVATFGIIPNYDQIYELNKLVYLQYTFMSIAIHIICY